MENQFSFDGLIFETFYIGGSYPVIFALYENNGLLTKTLIYNENGGLTTNAYTRKEVLISSENFYGLITSDSSYGSPAIYGHTVVHYGKLDKNNRLYKIATMGVIGANNSFTFLMHKPIFNDSIFLPGFALRTDYFSGSNYLGFPSAVIGATNFLNASTSFTTPAGCSSLNITFLIHNTGGIEYSLYSSLLTVSPSTFYNLAIMNSTGTNFITSNIIYVFMPLPDNLFMSSFRINVTPDVGTITPGGCTYSFNKFISICSRP